MERYDAFISYKTSTSRRSARRLNRHLLSIAKRHKGISAPKIFHDQYSLPPGRLREGLLDAVRSSRHLIVLIDREVAQSEWVAEEIQEWLAAGGTLDRLFLVRTDRQVDLSWDRATGSFAHQHFLPAPLRNLFTEEPAYIDYFPIALSRPNSQVARLCAAVTGSDPAEFLVVEGEIQRRRNRLTAGVAAVLVLLLMASVSFGYLAVVNEREARASAREAQAHADAAEAMLAVGLSVPRAIELAVHAGVASDAPSVRSALLAVAQEAQRLVRALTYPDDRAGHAPSGAAFSADGARFLAWGPGPANNSFLQVWEVATGRSDVSGTVDVTGLHDVVWINSRVAAACSDRGPIVLALRDDGAQATSLKDESFGLGSCRVHPMDGGALIQTGNGVAYYVNRRGMSSAVAGITSARARGKAAAAGGPPGVFFLKNDTWARAGDITGEVVAIDAGGRVLVRQDRTSWFFVDTTTALVTPVHVPPTAVSVAAVYGADAYRIRVGDPDFTDNLVWVDQSGVVGWSGDESTVQLTDEMGLNEPYASLRPYATLLVPVRDGSIIALFRNTVTVLRTPATPAPTGQAGREWQATERGWSRRVVPASLGMAERDYAIPDIGICNDDDAILIDTHNEGGLFIDSLGNLKKLKGPGIAVDSCSFADLGAGVSIVGPPSVVGDPIQVRTSSAAGQVFGSRNGYVAVMIPGAPIEIFGTYSDNSERKIWSTGPAVDGVPAAFGEQFIGGSVYGPEGIVAVRPDGLGMVREGTVSNPRQIVDGSSTIDAAPDCRDQPIRYVPAPGFERDLAAAEAQIPAAQLPDGRLVDCRTGQPLHDVPEVVRYEVGRERGLLVTRVASAISVTTWRRGETPRTISGPSIAEGWELHHVSDAGDAAVVAHAGRKILSIYRLSPSGAWNNTLTVTPNLDDVVDSALADDSSLLVAVSTRGHFQLYDAVNGRLLVTDTDVTFSSLGAVESVTAEMRGDDLLVHLYDRPTGEMLDIWLHAIRIPARVPAIITQLCRLYHAPDCPT